MKQNTKRMNEYTTKTNKNNNTSMSSSPQYHAHGFPPLIVKTGTPTTVQRGEEVIDMQ